MKYSETIFIQRLDHSFLVGKMLIVSFGFKL